MSRIMLPKRKSKKTTSDDFGKTKPASCVIDNTMREGFERRYAEYMRQVALIEALHPDDLERQGVEMMRVLDDLQPPAGGERVEWHRWLRDRCANQHAGTQAAEADVPEISS